MRRDEARRVAIAEPGEMCRACKRYVVPGTTHDYWFVGQVAQIQIGWTSGLLVGNGVWFCKERLDAVPVVRGGFDAVEMSQRRMAMSGV